MLLCLFPWHQIEGHDVFVCVCLSVCLCVCVWCLDTNGSLVGCKCLISEDRRETGRFPGVFGDNVNFFDIL